MEDRVSKKLQIKQEKIRQREQEILPRSAHANSYCYCMIEPEHLFPV